VQQRPGFAASLAMSSSRIASHESIHGVNRRGWYQGEGALFIYTPDATRYNDNFWPTVNPYRLPGVTLDTIERSEGARGPGNEGSTSKSPWAGGVELGENAIASMGLMARDVTLTAKKSWFFFGDAIICLGSGVNSTDGRAIETIVENSKLSEKANEAFTVDGVTMPSNKGWNEEMKGVRWAHLHGAAPNSGIGWVFPQPATLKALRENRTGSWLDLSVKEDPTPITRNYLTLWFDHGKSPVNANYQYIVLPGKSAESVKAYAASGDVEIIANTEAAQVVQSKALGLLGITLWQAATQPVAGISSNAPLQLLIEEKADRFTLAVSDPTQLQKSIEVGIGLKAARLVSKYDGVTVITLNPLKVSINTDKSDGKTFRATFEK
jgi:hyaluronate lyase